WVVRFQMYGLTPPLGLAWLAFRGDDVQSGLIGPRSGNVPEDALGALLCFVGGLVLWSAAGYVLWRLAARRFRVLAGRVPIPMPVGGPASLLPTQQGGSVAVLTPRPRRRRRVLAVGLGAGLVSVVLLVIGWGVFRAVSADRHLEEALAEVDRTDPGW